MMPTKEAEPKDDLADNTHYDSGCPKEKVVIRPLPRRNFTLSTANYSPAVESLIEQEIKEGLAELYERYRQQKRKPSGSDTEAVRVDVWKKYADMMLHQRLQMELWRQSERTLNILRSRGIYPGLQDRPSSQLLANYFHSLNLSLFPELDPSSSLYIGPESEQLESLFSSSANNSHDSQASRDLTHNAYFEQIYPTLVRDYGFPFYTTIRKTSYLSEQINPRNEQLKAINTHFFAALLGGDKRLGHDVVFYVPESIFYFYDPLISRYVPTTEAKIRFYLVHVLQVRVWGCDKDEADIFLDTFCAPKVLDAIIDHAKALLAAERGFFEGPRANPRFAVDDDASERISATIRSFIENEIMVDERGILTITECLAELEAYAKEDSLGLPRTKSLKHIVKVNVQQLHGKHLRNDLNLPDGRSVQGWKGLGLRPVSQGEPPIKPAIEQIRESDLSDQSDSVLELRTEPAAEIALLS